MIYFALFDYYLCKIGVRFIRNSLSTKFFSLFFFFFVVNPHLDKTAVTYYAIKLL